MSQRVAIYARCSAQRQADRDLSIPAQLDAARSEAQRKGWEVVAEYIDEAESARTDARPQFQEMISAAKKKPGPFSVILVWKFSRFARNREDSVLYKALLKRHGVRIVSLNEPIEDTPAGRMLEGMLEVLDEFYSANLAEDTARGMRKNAQRGYYNGGTPPTGYVTERTGEGASPKLVLKPCPTFAPLIRRMYRMALEGNGGATIAKTINGEGHRTLRGKLWTTQTVLNVLRNEVYAGTLVWGKRKTGRQVGKQTEPVRIEDNHEALVSPRDWRKVQKLIAARTRTKVNPHQIASDYLLAGLITCSHCGAPFIGHPAKGGKFHYYGCQTKMKSGASSCPSKLLNRDRAEEAVITELQNVVLTPANIRELVELVNQELAAESSRAQEALATITGQLTEARKKQDRLYEVIESGTLDMDVVAPRLKKWKQRADDLATRKADLEDTIRSSNLHPTDEAIIKAMVSELHRLLLAGSLDARKTFLRAWIRKIVANERVLTITYTLPPVPDPDDIGASGIKKEPRDRPGVLPTVKTGSPCWT